MQTTNHTKMILKQKLQGWLNVFRELNWMWSWRCQMYLHDIIYKEPKKILLYLIFDCDKKTTVYPYHINSIKSLSSFFWSIINYYKTKFQPLRVSSQNLAKGRVKKMELIFTSRRPWQFANLTLKKVPYLQYPTHLTVSSLIALI